MSTYLPAIFGENLMDVFDDFDRDFFRGFGNIDRALYGKHAQRMMKTDVKETDEGYEVDVELPGFKKDEIQLELNNGYLTITAEKGLDKENKKISLGYKREEDNPWNVFKSKYDIGSVAEVKILKFMPFGAFAEIVPGVDGLIHISQIADHRIDKPGDVLSEGQMVDVKIIDIDYENKKVSLSIRALLEAGEPADEDEDVNEE